MNVHFVVYDKKTFMLSTKLFSAIERYFDDNLKIMRTGNR